MSVPKRFQRQVQLPAIGEEGQRRLLGSTVLITGLGGLGCPAALHLAACGVGRLLLVDFDVVEESNLHRQTLYTAEHIGRYKAEVAAEVLSAAFPDTTCIPYVAEMDAPLALDLMAAADVVLDGTDRLETRYLTDDVCALYGKPWSYASVHDFSLQWAFFRPGAGYRRLFPVPPDPFAVSSCATHGVLGTVPALAGLHQAMDVLSHLLGLKGNEVTVHHLDVLRSAHYETEISAGPVPEITADDILRTDYPAFCRPF